MFSLIISVYLILLILVSWFICFESANKETFFKTVLSDLEYKVITTIAYIFLSILILPILLMWITDLQNGKPIAYLLALVYTIIFGGFAFETVKNKLQKLK